MFGLCKQDDVTAELHIKTAKSIYCNFGHILKQLNYLHLWWYSGYNDISNT